MALSVISIALMLLVAVLVLDPANHRWLRLGGPLGVQPSELAKPALVIFLAFFVTWRARAINNPRYTLVPAALAVGFVILLVVVADLGTAIVLAAAAALVFFVAGLEWRYCAIVGRAGAGRPRLLHLCQAVPAGPRDPLLRPQVRTRREDRQAPGNSKPAWKKA